MKSRRNRKRRNKLHSRKRTKKYLRKNSRKKSKKYSKKYSKKRSKKYGGADSPEGGDFPDGDNLTAQIVWLRNNYELRCVNPLEDDPQITFTDVLGENSPTPNYTAWKRSHTDKPCLLGKGQYGEVLFVINKRLEPPREEAMKYSVSQAARAPPLALSDLRTEVDVINKLIRVDRWDNIVRFHAAHQLVGGKFIFTMEKLDPTDLAGVLLNATNEAGQVNISEKIKLKYIQSMINGLQQLHHAGIFHCDIKPENFLVASNDVLKYTDFGFSQLSENKRAIAPHHPITNNKRIFGSADLISRLMMFYAFRKRVQCIKEDGYKVEGELAMDEGDNVVVVKADSSGGRGLWYAGYKENEDSLPDDKRTKNWFPANVVDVLPDYCDAHLNDLWALLMSITLLFGHKWLYETFFEGILGIDGKAELTAKIRSDLYHIPLHKYDYEKIKDGDSRSVGLRVHMESLGHPEIVDEILRLTLDTPKTSGLEDFDKGWLEIMDKNVSGLNAKINEINRDTEGVASPADRRGAEQQGHITTHMTHMTEEEREITETKMERLRKKMKQQREEAQAKADTAQATDPVQAAVPAVAAPVREVARRILKSGPGGLPGARQVATPLGERRPWR